MDFDLKRLPVWFIILCMFYIGGLLTYAVYSGRSVELLPPKIGPAEGSIADTKTQLWTIEGTLALKSYEKLHPELQEHLHELLLRIRPPAFEVDPDGKFRIRNVPVLVKGEREEPILEVYPIRQLLSQGYKPETIRISSQPATFGNDSTVGLVFDENAKIVRITTKVSLKSPDMEATLPQYSPDTATKPRDLQ